MPSPARRAVVYLQPGTIPTERQLRHCLAYCAEHGYHVDSIVPPSRIADAVAAVLAAADLVVTAFAARPGPGDLREQAAMAGVPVEYVRPPVVRREVADLLADMFRHSHGDVRRMASMLGETTEGLAAKLARLGIRKRRDNGTAPDSRE